MSKTATRTLAMPRILIAVAAVLLLNAATALAFNKAAHMVSGSIAYHALKTESPRTLEEVLALLKQHPEYGKFKLGAVAAEDHDLYLFMLTARWTV